MQKLMGDEGWGGGGLVFSTDPKCLWTLSGLVNFGNPQSKCATARVTAPVQTNAGQVGLWSSRTESSLPGSRWPGHLGLVLYSLHGWLVVAKPQLAVVISRY